MTVDLIRYKGSTLNFLNNFLQETPFLTLAIILMILFWTSNTFLLFLEFTQKIHADGQGKQCNSILDVHMLMVSSAPRNNYVSSHKHGFPDP